MFRKPQPSDFGLPDLERCESVPYLMEIVKVSKRKQLVMYHTALKAHEAATGFAKGVTVGLIALVLLAPHLVLVFGNGYQEQPVFGMEEDSMPDQPK